MFRRFLSAAVVLTFALGLAACADTSQRQGGSDDQSHYTPMPDGL